MDWESTDTTIIVCHETGEQFVPKNYIVVYQKGDDLEGGWRVKDDNGFQRLQLIEKALDGVHDAMRQTLIDLLEQLDKKRG